MKSYRLGLWMVGALLVSGAAGCAWGVKPAVAQGADAPASSETSEVADETPIQEETPTEEAAVEEEALPPAPVIEGNSDSHQVNPHQLGSPAVEHDYTMAPVE